MEAAAREVGPDHEKVAIFLAVKIGTVRHTLGCPGSVLGVKEGHGLGDELAVGVIKRRREHAEIGDLAGLHGDQYLLHAVSGEQLLGITLHLCRKSSNQQQRHQ